MKFKALLQIGLACLLTAALTAPAYAEEPSQAIPQDTPLPGDFQIAPAVRPSKPNTAQPQATPQRPAAKKHRTITHKHVSQHRAKHKAFKKSGGKLTSKPQHKKIDGKHASKSQKKSEGKLAAKPRKALHKMHKKPTHQPLKKLKHKKRKTKH